MMVSSVPSFCLPTHAVATLPTLKIAAFDVIVIVSLAMSAVDGRRVNFMCERECESTKLDGTTLMKVPGDTSVVVYPVCPVIGIVDTSETAPNVTVVATDGLSARPPTHVIVVAPLGSVAVPAVTTREVGVVINAPTALATLVVHDDG